NTIGIVPTAAQRTGDFSAALDLTRCGGPDPLGQPVCFNQVFDPSTQTVVAGSPVRTPFVGHKIPLTSMDPTAAIIQAMIPQPNTAGTVFNYTASSYSNYRHTTIPSVKIDHSLNDRMKLSGYYSATKTFSPQNNGFPQPFTATQPQNALSHTVRLN